MEDYKNTKLYKAIDEVLHYLWDPIGVAEVPQARDEYNHYTPEVYKLVIDNADDKTIAEYLYNIETDNMGLQPKNINHCYDLASIINDWKEFLKDK